MVDLADLAARFAGRLREVGVPVGPERTARFAEALTLVHPTSTDQLYWCALATLVGDPAEIPMLDKIFGLVFGGLIGDAQRGDPSMPPFRTGAEPAPPAGRRSIVAETMAGADTSPPATDQDEPESRYPALAAATERLATRDFASLRPD